MRKYVVAVAMLLSIPITAVACDATADGCQGVRAGADLDRVINSDLPSNATVFCLEAGTYQIDQTIELRDGDVLAGPAGSFQTRGPAEYGVGQVAKIRNGETLSEGLTQMVKMYGDSKVRWIDISGATGRYEQTNKPCPQPNVEGTICPRAGTGVAIAMGDAGPGAVVRANRIHDNEAVGVANSKGVFSENECDHNATNEDFAGFTGACVKGVTEFEARDNYVHDNFANGIWCDQGCVNDPARANGYWVHKNLIVKNDRWGERYEFSPMLEAGPHQQQPTSLVEDNEIHENGYGGASMRDAQNGIYRNNTFGAKNVAGTSYSKNGNGKAMVFGQSGDRTDIWNADAFGNSLGGESIVGCEEADNVVDCHDN